MTVLTHKQTLTFMGLNGETLTVQQKSGIQTIPDWIRDTGTFQAAVKAGYIVEIGILSEAPEVPAAPAKKSSGFTPPVPQQQVAGVPVAAPVEPPVPQKA